MNVNIRLSLFPSSTIDVQFLNSMEQGSVTNQKRNVLH